MDETDLILPDEPKFIDLRNRFFQEFVFQGVFYYGYGNLERFLADFLP